MSPRTGLYRPRQGLAVGDSCQTPHDCDWTKGLYSAGVRTESADTGECALRHELGATCDPAEYESCVIEATCSREGVCVSWPHLCEAGFAAHDSYAGSNWLLEGE